MHLAQIRGPDAVERFDDTASKACRDPGIAISDGPGKVRREAELVLLGLLLLAPAGTAALVLLAAPDLFEAEVKQRLAELAGDDERLVLIPFVGTPIRFDPKQQREQFGKRHGLRVGTARCG